MTAATREDIAESVSETHAQPLNVWVQSELERMIVQGELPPGERLNEIVLAQQMGVSRGPVREAIRSLERLGLVTTIMNRGAFVRTLALAEVAELYDLAAVLSGFTASRVAQIAHPEHGVTLSDMVRKMERLTAEADADQWFAINLAFHRAIFRFSGNKTVSDVYEDSSKRMLVLQRRTFERSDHVAQANVEHRAILDAILAGNADRAREQAEVHVRAGRARFLASISPEVAT